MIYSLKPATHYNETHKAGSLDAMVIKPALPIIAAKCAAVGSIVFGAVTACVSSSSIMTGLILSAAGLTAYVAARNIKLETYEITKHVPPQAKTQAQSPAVGRTGADKHPVLKPATLLSKRG
jgi:hypothetical protein